MGLSDIENLGTELNVPVIPVSHIEAHIMVRTLYRLMNSI